MKTLIQHSWQIKGFAALPVAIAGEAKAVEAYLGNQFNMRPDTAGSVFRGDDIGF